MFYVVGQHRKAMIDKKLKETIKQRKLGDYRQVDMGEVGRMVDKDIRKGKTIKLSSYFDSPAPALGVANLAKKNGAKKVRVEYFFFVMIGEKKKKKTATYKNEIDFRLNHNIKIGLI